MKRIAALLLGFIAGLSLIATSARLAAEGTLAAYFGVCALGMILFALVIVLALATLEDQKW